MTEKFQPLLSWMKAEATHVVRNGERSPFSCSTSKSHSACFIAVVISDRLVSSPCAIVADVSGYTANVERMIST